MALENLSALKQISFSDIRILRSEYRDEVGHEDELGYGNAMYGDRFVKFQFNDGEGGRNRYVVYFGDTPIGWFSL